SPDRLQKGLARRAERPAQLRDLEPHRVVRHRDIRPNPAHDVLAREKATRVAQKEEQQLATLVRQGDLGPLAEQAAADRVVQERSKSVSHLAPGVAPASNPNARA